MLSVLLSQLHLRRERLDTHPVGQERREGTASLTEASQETNIMAVFQTAMLLRWGGGVVVVLLSESLALEAASISNLT